MAQFRRGTDQPEAVHDETLQRYLNLTEEWSRVSSETKAACLAVNPGLDHVVRKAGGDHMTQQAVLHIHGPKQLSRAQALAASPPTLPALPALPKCAVQGNTLNPAPPCGCCFVAHHEARTRAVAVLGKTFAGKSTAIDACTQRFPSLVVLRVVELAQAAVRIYQVRTFKHSLWRGGAPCIDGNHGQEELDAVVPPAPPSFSQRAQLGQRVLQAQIDPSAGKPVLCLIFVVNLEAHHWFVPRAAADLPDDVQVSLVAEALERLSGTPGWILDGFPATRAQVGAACLWGAVFFVSCLMGGWHSWW
jgi:hypothetical protein